MLKALLAAILVALVVVILLLLPIFRPDRGTGSVAVNTAAAPPPSSFVIRNDTPPAPPVEAPVTLAAPAPDSLDAVMQRLRSGKPDATVVVTPAAPAAAVPTPGPVPAPTLPPVVSPAPPVDAPPPAPAPPRWTNVSGQGVQYRLGRAGDGYVISIDLGGGHVAEVHVLAAFGRLDQGAVDMRVDYLKQTILENFSSASASYSFNRDGSISRGR